MALLAEPEAVTDLLPQSNIPTSQLNRAMQLVAGWLKREARLDELPAELDDGDDLFSPAFELTVLVVTNPELLAAKAAGPTSKSWPVAQRRDAILEQVRADAAKAGSAPRGSFPPAPVWPDPARPTGWWDPVRQVWVTCP